MIKTEGMPKLYFEIIKTSKENCAIWKMVVICPQTFGDLPPKLLTLNAEYRGGLNLFKCQQNFLPNENKLNAFVLNKY